MMGPIYYEKEGQTFFLIKNVGVWLKSVSDNGLNSYTVSIMTWICGKQVSLFNKENVKKIVFTFFVKK